MIGASCVLLYIYSFQVKYIQIQMRKALFGFWNTKVWILEARSS